MKAIYCRPLNRPTLLLLVLASLLSTCAAFLHDHSIRTPAHVLAKRHANFPRALLEGQLTVGSLVNISVEIGSPSKTSSIAPSTLPTKTSSAVPPPPTKRGCFPFHTGGFTNGSVPNVTRDEWWCEDKEIYGFLGFSYPLEISDCSDPSNEYPKIKADLERMQSEFGATFVRPYGVECRQVSIWENLVKACVEIGMGLIVQVWWGFQDDQNLWRTGQESIYDLFENSSYADIAPYIVYSASFGSEPVGDWVDGDEFVPDLASFRLKMNSFGVPVGISEDWDRPDRMKTNSAVSGIGSEVLNNTDVAQLHVMPYYHPDEVPTIDGAWDYIKQQVEWARETLKQPVMTMWSSQQGGSHGRGSHDDQSTIENYEQYWNAFNSNCEFFKKSETGYFVHTYDDSMEPYFGMIDSDGKTKIDGWKPKRC
ncbi:hypothetical protein JCM16303_002487 [Sporobolomyces ruberrimus]